MRNRKTGRDATVEAVRREPSIARSRPADDAGRRFEPDVGRAVWRSPSGARIARTRAETPRRSPFDIHGERYDQWFEDHRIAYASELLALRPFVPWQGRGLEIGVGTARFAGPLGVRFGVDPSRAMLIRAAARGVAAAAGTAEALPFASRSFDYGLIVTTICFVESPQAMMAEARRVLRPGGTLVIGFIDRDSALGQYYHAHRSESVFYRDAVFYTVSDVNALLRQAGFTVGTWGQTLSRPLPEITEIEPLRPGTGRGSFVVVSAKA